MPPTQRGLKKSYSQSAEQRRKTKFTVIVDEQDGKCWFCGIPMGGDCSKEHLFSQSQGGTDDWPEANLKASHKDCNSAAGHLPVPVKYHLREIAHKQGRAEMFHVALQMRRADARMAFSAPRKYKIKDPEAYWKKLQLPGKPDWWDEIYLPSKEDIT